MAPTPKPKTGAKPAPLKLENEPEFDAIFTPKGVGRYLWLREKDTKWDADGEFKGTLLLDAKDPKTKKFVRELDGLVAAAGEWCASEFRRLGKKGEPKAGPLPYTFGDDESEFEGMVAVKFKTKATGKRRKDGARFEKTIPLFDIHGQPLADDVEFGAGSTIKVKVTPVVYFTALVGYGISLRLEAVQVIKPVKWAKDAGFEDESENDEDADDDATDTEAEADADETDEDSGDEESGDGDF